MTYKDFNKMTEDQLLGLKGIGKVTAKRIMDRRKKYKFTCDEDLLKIKGLGKATLTKNGMVFQIREKAATLNTGKSVKLTEGFAQSKSTGAIDYYWRFPRADRLYFYTKATYKKLGLKCKNVIFVDDMETITM